MEDSELNEYYIYLKFAELMDLGKKEDSSDYVIKLLKSRDRVQKLLRSGLTMEKLSNFSEIDIKIMVKNKFIKEVDDGLYILTIKGLLKAVSLSKDEKKSDYDIYQNFLEKLFDSEFKIEQSTKQLIGTEKIWLLSLIFLNCFNDASSIDILFNETNKELYVDLFNKIGTFLKENGYEKNFIPLNKNEEILRRELEKINKKLYNIEFSKSRDKFYIKLKGDKADGILLTNILKKIFTKIGNERLDLSDIQDIRKLMVECEPFFFKIKRHKEGKNTTIQPNIIVEEAIKNLI